MNRKSPPSLAGMILAGLIVAASLMLAVASAQPGTSHKNKVVKTTITLRTSTQIGNMTLSPGTYRLKIAPASDASGHPTVQLSIVESSFGDASNPPYDESVVPTPAEDEVAVLVLKASTVSLPAPAESTRLIATSSDSSKASALEIRGSTTQYVFTANTDSAAKGQ